MAAQDNEEEEYDDYESIPGKPIRSLVAGERELRKATFLSRKGGARRQSWASWRWGAASNPPLPLTLVTPFRRRLSLD